MFAEIFNPGNASEFTKAKLSDISNPSDIFLMFVPSISGIKSIIF